MKKLLLLSLLLMNLIAVQATAQCEGTHLLCKKQLSKEDKKEGWNVNKQSESVPHEKGKVYETTVTAHKGLEYRLSACTDIAGGTAAKFKLEKDIMVAKTDSAGNTSVQKEREVVFDNTTDNDQLYVLFRSNETTTFYLTVTVPAVGKSKSKKLDNPELVCVGVLLEHRRTTKSTF